MKIASFISEARRNPAQNKKIDTLFFLQSLRDKCDKLENGYTNCFVSFVQFDKVGVNPNPIDSTTPIGIYAYPIDIVIQNYNKKHGLYGSVPYAGGYEVMNFFSIPNSNKCLFLSNEQQGHEFEVKVREYFTKTDQIDEFEEALKWARGRVYKAFQGTFSGPRVPVQQTKVLRQMGYDSVFDDTGRSMIAIEPFQIVFLGVDCLKHIRTIKNPETMLGSYSATTIKDKSFSTVHKFEHQRIFTPLQMINKKLDTRYKSIEDFIQHYSEHSGFALGKVQYELDKETWDGPYDIIRSILKEFAYVDAPAHVLYDMFVTDLRSKLLFSYAYDKILTAKIFDSSSEIHDQIISNMKFLKQMISSVKKLYSAMNMVKFKKIMLASDDAKTQAIISYLHSMLSNDPIWSKLDFSKPFKFENLNSTNYNIIFEEVFIRMLREAGAVL